MLTEAHVCLRDVTRIFQIPNRPQGLKALGPIDLDLKKGEFFAIVGPSGCGKSTLLDIVAGLSRANSGFVEFEGRRINGEVPESVGIVFQQDACFPWLTVYENIAFGLRRLRVPEEEISHRVDDALTLIGLTEFKSAVPSELSGGMRQRVCIARALVMRPSLLLLDEPFGALDQQTRLLMGEELLRLWRETQSTILLITHSLDEAAMLADRIGIMSARPGRLLEVVETGWPRDRDSRIVEQPEFGSITAHLWSVLREESRQSMKLPSR
jgi:NitT/TauT family transport system ATP-binding protein